MTSAYIGYSTSLHSTPQSRPVPGREAEMTPNNAGGVTFILDDWKRLERFCVLGSDGGSYYVNQGDLTAQNADVAVRCIKADGVRAVQMALNINVTNRAPKVDQQLFVLALAMKHGDAETKAAVAEAAPPMLRTGTHLLHFAAMLDSLGGWSRSKRRLIGQWFTERDPETLAYQVVKYQNRDGWRLRDVLRVTHPGAPSSGHRAVYDWVCGRVVDAAAPGLLHAYAHVNGEDGTDVERALTGIAAGLPREALPTAALQDPAVWRAQLLGMPLHALLRNLGNLSAAGVLVNGAPECRIVASKLTDATALKRARVHPFAILLATLVYKGGAGIRGNKTWTPVPAVLSALEDAYDLAFDYVKPTGKRILVAIDISASMSAACVGTPISASTAAAAVAVTLARLEPHALVVQFDSAVQKIVPVTRRTGIASLEATSSGGTDLAAPILWASGKAAWRCTWYNTSHLGPPAAPQVFDAFVVLTDNETWAGSTHSSQALEAYRREISPGAKLVCCSMAANRANIVDPLDADSFGCAGLDANIPALVADFIG